jgi:arginine exporter protein ArgO
MSAAFAAGILAGYGVAIPVGAIAALIVSLTARTSLRVGAGAALGAASADGIYAVVAVLGGTAVAGLVAPISTPLRWFSAAVLVGLAALGARSALLRHACGTSGVRAARGLDTPRRAYLGLLGLTMLNPATIVYFGALVLGRQAADGQAAADEVWLTNAAFVAGVFVSSASWQLVLACGGKLLGQLLTGPRGRLLTALTSSAVIAVLAVLLVV